MQDGPPRPTLAYYLRKSEAQAKAVEFQSLTNTIY